MDRRKQYNQMRRLEPDFYVDRFEETRRTSGRWTSGLIEVVTIVGLFVLTGLVWYASEKTALDAVDEVVEVIERSR